MSRCYSFVHLLDYQCKFSTLLCAEIDACLSYYDSSCNFYSHIRLIVILIDWRGF